MRPHAELGILLAGPLFALCSCQGGGSPVMEPGRNCLDCHGGSRSIDEHSDLVWVAAGTIYGSPTASANEGLQGATVTLTDAQGRSVTLTSNAAGNFYTREPLQPPFRVRVEHNGHVQQMSQPREGACNDCHRNPPKEDAPGRIYVE